MNEGELTSVAAFLSLDGLMVSVINAAYQEVALLGVCSTPALWEVEVNARWKILGIELAAWLEDHWQNEKLKASLHDQIEVRACDARPDRGRGCNARPDRGKGL